MSIFLKLLRNLKNEACIEITESSLASQHEQPSITVFPFPQAKNNLIVISTKLHTTGIPP